MKPDAGLETGVDGGTGTDSFTDTATDSDTITVDSDSAPPGEAPVSTFRQQAPLPKRLYKRLRSLAAARLF